TLTELVLAADRSFMLEGVFEDADDDLPPAELVLTDANDGWYAMSNGLTRLQSRFFGHDEALEAVRASLGKHPLPAGAAGLGLVTFPPDALTGLEANYRFVGPETLETKIFGRLTAWQNWIFQRPNASGPDGALRRY